MIPEFPKFKKLELSDRKEIEKHTSKFPPYSDFNFVSMWSWDIKGEMQISELYGNLVIRFTDYLNGKFFYSFIGKNKINETASLLLISAKKKGLEPMLHLVPEESVKSLDSSTFDIVEDRDHFDYIYPVDKISHYLGSEYQKHRKMVRRFEKQHKFEVLNLNLADLNNQKLLYNLVMTWINDRDAKEGSKEDYLEMEDLQNEFAAFKRLLSAPEDIFKNLTCLSLFVDGVLCGFIINEKVSKDYFLSHFGKANTLYEGIYQFLMQKNARTFLDLGVSYQNHEQDLGLPNLRYSKSSYKPAFFLKKYTLALKDHNRI